MSDTTDATQDAADQTDATRGDAAKDGDDAALKDAGKKALESERTARRAAEKSLKALESRIAEFENRDKSDTERLTAERDRLAKDLEAREAKLRDVNARGVVTDAATKAGAISPSAVFALVRGDLEYDADGEPTNVDAVIAAAKKDEPKLFPGAPGKADAGAGSTHTDREIKPGMDRIINAYANIERNKRRG